jgi:hypothetical protein
LKVALESSFLVHHGAIASPMSIGVGRVELTFVLRTVIDLRPLLIP